MDDRFRMKFKRLRNHQMRMLELDKITINQATKWDRAKNSKRGKISRKSTKLKNQEVKDDVLNIYEDVKVFDYAAEAFNRLRLMDGITTEMIKVSFDPEANYKQALKAGESTGKSGSFFFFTHDERFIIKTIFVDELNAFMFDL